MIKIVIIDDEKWVRKLIKNLLPYNKYAIDVVGEASDGKEGLDLVIAKRPDIILTDIRMPLLSGLELIKELNSRVQKAKIIIITGHDSFEYAQTALKYGVIDFLLKPIEEKDLNTAISKALKEIKKDEEISRAKLLEKQVKRLSMDYIQPNSDEFCEISNDKIRKSLKFIHENYQNPISLNDVSDAVLMNSSYLSEVFKKEVGFGFNQYLIDLRFNEAKELLLKNKNLSIGDISEMVGFMDSNYFSRLFKKKFRCTPIEYRTSFR